MTYEEFCDYAEYVVINEVPEELLVGLNGGIQINLELKRDSDERNYIVFGQYIRDNLGKRIVLYYGTFRHMYSGMSNDQWRHEILRVIKHELRHHIEARAGQEDLAKLEKWEKQKRQSNH